MTGLNVLEIRQLDKSFVSHKRGTLVHAVDHVNLTLAKGEFLGIVGESGCGKSTIAKLVMGLLTPDGGEILLDGEALRCPYSREVYKRLQMIFQMPKDSFDPRRTIGKCLTGVLKNFGTPAEQCREKAVALLERVGLNDTFFNKYPHEMSGGECQRAAIARAMAAEPEILICDEITSALDVSVQAQIVDLILRLKEKGEISVIFISHDLALVQGICDRIFVMRDGKAVEEGTTDKILSDPDDPYTRALIDAVFDVK
ncbi:MAG: ABC transporter ATP-binding protein [Oscillospiraceae bacterium]|nr:ABC transporter ATP-binding protein [Oscillospiraceae bacterium]